MNTVTRAQLGEAVYREVGLSRGESAKLVESVLEAVTATLADGEAVKISSFGSFLVREKAERIGRNPKTRQEVPILPRRVVVFRASHVLKNRVNAGPKAPRRGADRWRSRRRVSWRKRIAPARPPNPIAPFAPSAR